MGPRFSSVQVQVNFVQLFMNWGGSSASTTPDTMSTANPLMVNVTVNIHTITPTLNEIQLLLTQSNSKDASVSESKSWSMIVWISFAMSCY